MTLDEPKEQWSKDWLNDELEIGRGTDGPRGRKRAAWAEKQLAAERIIFDAPFVQAMMRDVGAKILPGSIKPI